VYIFTRTDLDDWEQRAYLKASNTEAEDLFGWSIALSGGRLAIGAINEDSGSAGINGDQADNSGALSGAVYFFAADASGNWSQQLYMKSSDPQFADRLGQGLALTDWGLVAGAPGDETAAGTRRDSGIIHVFE
jgi:trimeric autotransporter adhesin